MKRLLTYTALCCAVSSAFVSANDQAMQQMQQQDMQGMQMQDEQMQQGMQQDMQQGMDHHDQGMHMQDEQMHDMQMQQQEIQQDMQQQMEQDEQMQDMQQQGMEEQIQQDMQQILEDDDAEEDEAMEVEAAEQAVDDIQQQMMAEEEDEEAAEAMEAAFAELFDSAEEESLFDAVIGSFSEYDGDLNAIKGAVRALRDEVSDDIEASNQFKEENADVWQDSYNGQFQVFQSGVNRLVRSMNESFVALQKAVNKANTSNRAQSIKDKAIQVALTVAGNTFTEMKREYIDLVNSFEELQDMVEGDAGSAQVMPG